MLLNTAGGITGGDQFDIKGHAGTNAALTLTTQAAERTYAAQPGPAGRLTTTLSTEPGATLRWLPQETILFDKSRFDRTLNVELAADSNALIVEPLVFGRAAHGETLHDIQFRDTVRIRQDGRMIYADGMHLTGNAVDTLAHPATGNGTGAMATLILVSESAELQLEPLRSLCAQKIGSTAGVSLLSTKLLVMRCLAEDSFTLRQRLLPVLDHLTQDQLPICWRL